MYWGGKRPLDKVIRFLDSFLLLIGIYYNYPLNRVRGKGPVVSAIVHYERLGCKEKSGNFLPQVA